MPAMTPGSHAATTYAAGTSAFGGAAAIILVWALGTHGVVVPDYVAVAFGVVLTAATSFVLRFIPQPKEIPNA